MALKAYHLQTWRVSGLQKDMTPKIEDITVKLVGEISFEKYCKFLTVRGYIVGKPPQIIKVLEREKVDDDLKWKELGEKAIIEAQQRVIKLLNIPKVGQKVDYKSEFEGQKKRNDDLEARLKELEKIKPMEYKPLPKNKPGPKKKEASNPTGNE